MTDQAKEDTIPLDHPAARAVNLALLRVLAVLIGWLAGIVSVGYLLGRAVFRSGVIVPAAYGVALLAVSNWVLCKAEHLANFHLAEGRREAEQWDRIAVDALAAGVCGIALLLSLQPILGLTPAGRIVAIPALVAALRLYAALRYPAAKRFIQALSSLMERVVARGAKDGLRALTALKEAEHRGQLPRDWDEDTLNRALTLSGGKTLIGVPLCYAYYRHLDLGEPDAAIDTLRRLRDFRVRRWTWRAFLAAETAYTLACFEGDPAAARDCLAAYRGPANDFGLFYRVSAAILLAEGRLSSARACARIVIPKKRRNRHYGGIQELNARLAQEILDEAMRRGGDVSREDDEAS